MKAATDSVLLYCQDKPSCRFAAAIILCLLAHAVPFLIFSLPAQTGATIREKTSSVTLLPLAGALSPRQRQLVSELKTRDPSLFTSGNRDAGFSRVAAISGLRSRQPDVDFFYPDLKVAPEPGDFEAIPVRNDSPLEVVSKSWDYSYPVIPGRDEPESEIEYPNICFSGGRVLESFFGGAGKLKKISGKLKPVRATHLRLLPGHAGALPRVLLARSCGEKELDRAAAEYIIRNSSKLKEYDIPANKYCLLEINWRPGAETHD